MLLVSIGLYGFCYQFQFHSYPFISFCQKVLIHLKNYGNVG